MAPANDLVINIKGDNKDFNKAVEGAEESSKGLADQLASIAKISGVAFAGLTAVIGTTVAAFRVQEQAQFKLNAVLQSTGMVAGVSAEEVKALASSIQGVTTFGDEAVIASSALLLSFTRIGGEIFPRAQRSITDVAAALGIDLKQATVLVGKTLNDPIEGLNSLTRVGIRFDEQQKELIKGLVDTGRAAEAQTIILGLLETKFGGQAEAAAQGTGALIQLRNVFGDLLEVIGEQFVPIIAGVAQKLTAFIQVLSQNEVIIKRVALALGVGAVGTGLIFGITSLGALLLGLPAIITAVTTAFAFLTAPIIAIPALIIGLVGVFALLVAKWDEVNSAVFSIFPAIGAFFQQFVLGVAQQFNNLGDLIEGVFTLNFAQVQASFQNLIKGVPAIFTNSAKTAAANFTSNFRSDLQARSGEVGSGLDRIVDKVREFGVKQFNVLKDSATKTLGLDRQTNETLINSSVQKNDALIAEETLLGEELIAIDENIGNEQVSVFDNTTNRLISSAQQRRSQLAATEITGGDVAGEQIAPREVVITDPKLRELFDNPERFVFGPKGFQRRVGFQRGFSGEGFQANFGGREIVIPENFAEGIRSGRFALTASGAQGGGQRVAVDINFRGQAAQILTAKQSENRALGTSREF